MSIYSGYFLAAPNGEVPSKAILINQTVEPKVKISEVSNEYTSKLWETYTVHSSKPLSRERQLDANETFKYQILLAKGKNRIVLLGDKADVAKFIFKNILCRVFYPNLRQIYINIDSFVRDCEDRDSTYLITVLYGRYAGENHNVNSISLFGEDVTNSASYESQKGTFDFYLSGIKTRPSGGIGSEKYGWETSSTGTEIMRVANDGFFTSSITSKAQCGNILRALNYFTDKNYVDSWVSKLEE